MRAIWPCIVSYPYLVLACPFLAITVYCGYQLAFPPQPAGQQPLSLAGKPLPVLPRRSIHASEGNGLRVVPAKDEGTVESGGISITIKSMRREQDQCEMTYAFERVECPPGEPPFCFIRGWGIIDMLFYDAVGHEMEEARGTADFMLSPDFAFWKTRLHEGRAMFLPPPGAKWVAIGFLQAEIVTKKTAIPG